MLFVEMLKERKTKGPVRNFEPIEISKDIHISVQGSAYHYCIPKKTLPADQYTHMEVVLMSNGFIADIRELTSNETLIKKMDFYGDEQFYTFVPVELIEELYLDLKKLVVF